MLELLAVPAGAWGITSGSRVSRAIHASILSYLLPRAPNDLALSPVACSDEILAALGELVGSRSGAPCRRGPNGSLLFVFRNTEGSTFQTIEESFNAGGADGKEIHGTRIRVRVVSRGDVVDWTGDDVTRNGFTWNADFLAIKRDDLPALTQYAARQLVSEIESFMAAGGRLDAAPADLPAKGKGSRKAVA